MKTIITIQTTESQYRRNGMVGSWSDWPLTTEGRAQATRIGNSLKQALGDVNYLMYTSDLLRSVQTAEAIGAPFGFAALHTPGLRPQHLGSAVGKTQSWFEANKQPFSPGSDPLAYRAMEDAESNREFLDRMRDVLLHILDKPDKAIMLVAHGDTLGAIFYLWANGRPAAYMQHRFSGVAGGVSILGLESSGARWIKKINDTSYLNAK